MNWPCSCGERAEERQVKNAKIGCISTAEALSVWKKHRLSVDIPEKG
jgi:hypothetical protein